MPLETYNEKKCLSVIDGVRNPPNCVPSIHYNTEQQQADYVAKAALQISSLTNFKAYFFYELLDCVDLAIAPNNYPHEAYYGIIALKNDTVPFDHKKIAFEYYRHVINPLHKSVTKSDVHGKIVLTYNLSYMNPTQNTYTNLLLKDFIPVGTKYISVSATTGATLSNDILSWKISTLAPGARKDFTFKVER